MDIAKPSDIWKYLGQEEVRVVYVHDVKEGDHYPDYDDVVYYTFDYDGRGELQRMPHGMFVKKFELRARSRV